MLKTVFNYKLVTITMMLVSSAVAQTPLKKAELTKSDRIEWRKILSWPDDCEEAFQELYKNDNYAGLEFHQLGPKKYLVQVTCYPGAYQPGFVFMFYDEASGKANLLKLKRYEREENGRVTNSVESEILGFPTFNAKTKELEIFSKSRGPGDCGYLATYIFINGKPMVKEARAQACYSDADFNRVHNPRRWPKVAKP